VSKRWTVLLALLVLGISACTNGGGGATAASGGSTAGTPASGATTGPADLTRALLAIEQGSRYRQSDWGYVVLDQKTGEVLASQDPVRMFDPGSTMKTFTITGALEAGAESVREPADQPYGDRNAGVKDAFGNQWFVATQIRPR